MIKKRLSKLSQKTWAIVRKPILMGGLILGLCLVGAEGKTFLQTATIVGFGITCMGICGFFLAGIFEREVGHGK